MSTGIVTFFDSYNYGAFMQAKALQDFLKEEAGGEVYFLQTGQRKFFKEYLRKLYSQYKAGFLNPKGALFTYRLCRDIASLKKEFSVRNLSEVKEGDFVVFGSDEIWNIKRKSNSDESAAVLWGKGFPESAKKISYAPSMNDSTVEMLENRPDLIELAKSFSALSARDRKSCEILRQALGKTVEQVVDPTLLHGKAYYTALQTQPADRDYILVYSYGTRLKKEDVELIRRKASEEGRKIISFGNYLPFADKNVSGGYRDFLGYFSEASFVFTDTFHGTVFSFIYQKPVCIFINEGAKVTALVESFSLSVFTDRSKIGKLDYQAEYSRASEIMKTTREKSIGYLIKFFKEEKK